MKLLVAAATNSSSQIALREDALVALMQKTSSALQAQLVAGQAVGAGVSQVGNGDQCVHHT